VGLLNEFVPKSIHDLQSKEDKEGLYLRANTSTPIQTLVCTRTSKTWSCWNRQRKKSFRFHFATDRLPQYQLIQLHADFVVNWFEFKNVTTSSLFDSNIMSHNGDVGFVISNLMAARFSIDFLCEMW
jgi:hypothetical protein